jgi:hypothetical protein
MKLFVQIRCLNVCSLYKPTNRFYMNMRLLQRLNHIAEALRDQCERRKVWLLCGFSAVYLVGTCLVAARKPMWNDELFTFYFSPS